MSIAYDFELAIGSLLVAVTTHKACKHHIKLNAEIKRNDIIVWFGSDTMCHGGFSCGKSLACCNGGRCHFVIFKGMLCHLDVDDVMHMRSVA